MKLPLVPLRHSFHHQGPAFIQFSLLSAVSPQDFHLVRGNDASTRHALMLSSQKIFMCLSLLQSHYCVFYLGDFHSTAEPTLSGVTVPKGFFLKG